MAVLYYENLDVHRPDILMKKSFNGLKNFYKFLDKNQKYLESPKAVKRLSWDKISENDLDETEKNTASEHGGKWIQLIEPNGFDGNVDAVMKLFLDENNSEVYEASQHNWQQMGRAARECPHCKTKQGEPRLSYASEEQAWEATERQNISLKVYECPKGHGWHLSRDVGEQNLSFFKSSKITVLNRNPDKERLLLDRLPEKEMLVLRPNTHQLRCQIKALQALQDRPQKQHLPLLQLFESIDYAEWKSVSDFNQPTEWLVLTDENRQGTKEQRDFVNIALNTPDFAFLIGPPGSGKTTTICELILQLIQQGKRILLCASTHVAVDNVLERLMDNDNPHKDHIIPIRIGDSANVSEKVKPWQLQEFLKTEKKRLLDGLRNEKSLTSAQKMLQEQLQKDNKTLERMVLDAANVICGTTIGILQHPDIREKGKQEPQFDVMIIDEASKTTFQEFLVPALLAERWILVGDPKQLSPYVDDEAMAVNIESCLPDQFKRQACLDVFQAALPIGKQKTALIQLDEPKKMDFYIQQAESKQVLIGHQNSDDEHLPYSQIVVGDEDFFAAHQRNLPLDANFMRGKLPDSVIRKMRAHYRLIKQEPSREETTWQDEIAWRIARYYEQRLNNNDSTEYNKTSQKLKQQIEKLLPYDNETVWKEIDNVRRVALPSILESLQTGFERNEKQKQGTAISDGLPKNVLEERLVTLSYQHRMHPNIADFSHCCIYNKEALLSSANMDERRAWTYSSSKRLILRDIPGKKDQSNANQKEIDAIIQELEKFNEWAKNNPNPNGKSWEVAILTFYRGQERTVRNALRKWTKNHRAFRYFQMKNAQKNTYLEIQVCTVDRFQGHEADLVLLSFVSPHATSFLESPNRLNVAITRARYQLIVLGNRQGLQKSSGILGNFVKECSWDTLI